MIKTFYSSLPFIFGICFSVWLFLFAMITKSYWCK